MSSGRLRVEDLTRLRVPGDPQLTADGSRVAFTLTVADVEADRLVSHIWVAEPGRAPVQWTFGPEGESSPRWSPDGRRLAFLAARSGGRPQVHVLGAGGGEAVALTSLPGGAFDLAWSPDGRWLAVAAAVAQQPEETEAQKAAPLEIDRLGYKLDGAGFLVKRRLHLFKVPAEGGEPLQLTDGDFSVAGAAWSPDGTRIAFTAALHPDRDLDGAQHLFTVPASGGELQQVVGGTWGAAAPVWTPDGSRLVFAGRRQKTDVQTSLFAVASGGGEPAPLLAGFDRTVMVGAPAYPGGRPAFAGDTLVFCARIGGCTHVYGLRLGGPPNALITGWDRVVQGLAVNATGRGVAVIATPETPGELFAFDVDASRQPERITRFGGAALEDLEIALPEARRFVAPDGTELEGYVWGAEPGARKPLLLNVHGGPHNAWTPALSAFELHHQELVAHGWCVLALNPRGSDGYGEAFMRAVVGGWGVKDEQDFMAAIDALVADGTADPDRLAVTGYSYGGFMTTWLTGHTDRFRCGIAGGAVTNVASEYGTSDFGAHMADAEYGGADPHDDPEQYRRLSPLSRVKDIKAPLLILHGERDDRCDLGQAEELFTALRRLRREVKMVIYPGASHLFVATGRPSHQLDYQRRLIAWLQAHVPAGEAVEA